MEHVIEMRASPRRIVVRTGGSATYEGFVRLIAELLAPPYVELDVPVVVDMRMLDMRSLPTDSIRDLAIELWEQRSRLKPLRHALVVNEEVTFGLSRLFEQFMAGQSPVTFRVFYSLEDAERWAGGTGEASP